MPIGARLLSRDIDTNKSNEDGVRFEGGQQPTPSSSASPATEPKQPAPKVQFRPLSPESTRTLQRHREETNEALLDGADDESSIGNRGIRRSKDSYPKTRSLSESSFDRLALSRRDRGPRDASPHSSDDDGDVVDLPDRFDSSGRPLNPRDRPLHRRRSSYGEFEYRPRHPGDLSVRGQWATFPAVDDPEVARLAQTVGSLLQGQRGFLGTLGHLLQDGVRR
ncbi:hypothetical protein NUW58_g10360 [Xylaria curta]|uniref:Uncharacterized protein n=1 Tax=Xylaria curta TaxID=42375 RepID=A0ACC1MLC9_9PEZI|nr:hypothetical protein NUW58_g10360 [Xylaria curta]